MGSWEGDDGEILSGGVEERAALTENDPESLSSAFLLVSFVSTKGDDDGVWHWKTLPAHSPGGKARRADGPHSCRYHCPSLVQESTGSLHPHSKNGSTASFLQPLP